MIKDKNLDRRIENYWDERSKNFSKNRRLELNGADFFAWNKIIAEHLPDKKVLKILDVGTGAGFFASLLAKCGHEVTGIDMSAEMLREAEKNTADFNCSAEFIKMDAQILKFPDAAFDVIISRNLTWTLPDVMEAYREWRRVLKVGGVLLNFDSDYGRENFNRKICAVDDEVEDKLLAECDSIKSALKISTHTRPEWDVEFLQSLNFDVEFENDIAPLVHKDKVLAHDSVPLFAIYAKK